VVFQDAAGVCFAATLGGLRAVAIMETTVQVSCMTRTRP
jgi:hypothetical protein